MTRRAKSGLAAALALALLVGFALLFDRQPSAGGEQKYSVVWFDVFDTVTTLTGYADSEQTWNAQSEALHQDLLRYHRLFDIYHHYDGITNLADVNAAAGAGPVVVDDEIFSLLQFAQQMYGTTDGACNVAAGAVLTLWHDAREAAATAESATAAVLPTGKALQAAAQHCAMQDLLLDQSAGTVAFADPEMTLDVGSIGKGYAVEMAARAAEARGLTSALLNAGGNVRAIGAKPDGKPWTAGVENPWPDAAGNYSTAASLATVALAPGESLVISGDYQRYFTVDDVRYHHLIDLTTLQPARHMTSVAVRCASSALGDALSTGLFCMPTAAGQALVARLDGVEALWMLADGTTLASAGWQTSEP